MGGRVRGWAEETPRGRLAPLFLFLLVLGVYIYAALQVIAFNAPPAERSFLLTGDEPYYLLATRSLAVDGDFDLYDDFAEKKFHDFIPEDIPTTLWLYKGFDVLKRHFPGDPIPEGTHPAKYMRWGYGLPLLMAPAYRWGLRFNGQVRLAVTLFHALLAAMTALLIYRMALELSGDVKASLLATLFVALADPLLPYSHELFPDFLSGSFILIAILALGRISARNIPPAWLVIVIAAFIPFLHQKLVPVSVILGLTLLTKVYRHLGLLFFLFAAGLGSAFFRGLHNKLAFGSWAPSSAEVDNLTFSKAFFEGITGYLFDRDSGGLLWHLPIILFAVVGGVMALRSVKGETWAKREPVVLSLLSVGVLAGLTVCYKNWQGGESIPLRYAAPFVILLAPFLAVAYARSTQIWARTFFWFFGLLGVAAAFWHIPHPAFYYDLYNHFWHDVLGAQLYHALPSINLMRHSETPLYDRLLGFILLLAIMGFVRALIVRGECDCPPPRWVTIVVAILTGLTTLLIVASAGGALWPLSLLSSFVPEASGRLIVAGVIPHQEVGVIVGLGWAVLALTPLGVWIVPRRFKWAPFALAVGLTGLLFVTENTLTERHITSLAPGEISGHAEAGKSVVFGRGWSWPEEGFRWSDGSEADISFKPSDAFKQDVIYQLTVTARSLDTQKVTVTLNGQMVGEMTFDGGEGEKRSLAIDGKRLRPGVINHLGFLPSNPHPPTQKDRRELGLALRQFVMREQ